MQILKEAHIGTDGPALLEYLARHTGDDATLLRIPQLIAELGDKDYRKREKAQKTLVALGPPAHAPLLRAAKDPTAEIATRARVCADAIHRGWNIWAPRSAVRRLLQLKQDGTARALLQFLPYTADRELDEEIWFGVYGRAKECPALLLDLEKYVQNPVPGRRALSACVMGRLGDQKQRATVRAALKDPVPEVRLRAAQGLLAGNEKVGIPTLIALLEHPDIEICWQPIVSYLLNS